jgi:DNA-binding NtrC family response regulator
VGLLCHPWEQSAFESVRRRVRPTDGKAIPRMNTLRSSIYFDRASGPARRVLLYNYRFLIHSTDIKPTSRMKLRILIADDERPARFALRRALACDDYEIVEAEDGAAVVEFIRAAAIDLVFLDLTMPVRNGLEVLREVRDLIRTTEVIIVTADDTVPSAVACIQAGATDYINKPYEVEQIRAIARRAARRVELERRLDQLQSELDQKHAFGALIGVSRPMRDLFYKMQRAAQAPINVLIRGETGTGKELIAREVHRLSARANGPFVAVNTAAIAESLAESELFGHVRGAFTGATSDRQGVFEQAHGGTLFLDEIGDMPLPAQTKILRALQERTIQPVGSAKPLIVDVRVITATHQNLEEAIAEKRFRQDLFYRIKGIELYVPPLRNRREDILVLANYFLERIAGPQQPAAQWDNAAVERLLAYSWPGNVRELEHAVAAASAMAIDGFIRALDIPIGATEGPKAELSFDQLMNIPLTEAKTQLVESFERHAIHRALELHGGNVSAAARKLGIHRQSLQQKMTQLGIRLDQRTE